MFCGHAAPFLALSIIRNDEVTAGISQLLRARLRPVTCFTHVHTLDMIIWMIKLTCALFKLLYVTPKVSFLVSSYSCL